jgi:predicted RecB family nuclease
MEGKRVSLNGRRVDGWKYALKVARKMNITASLFDAGLKCLTKCFLRSLGEAGTGNAYAEWVRLESASHHREGIKRLMARGANGECLRGLSGTGNLKTVEWRFAVDFVARSKNLESSIHVLERIPSGGRGGSVQLIPSRFTFYNKLTRDDKLLLAFDALVLSEMLSLEVSLGRIIHGDNHCTLKVKTTALTREVRKLIVKLDTVLSSHSPPDLVLKRHCGECEFQAQCRKRAIEQDDLSLLAGMTEKERKKYNSKGIFTVTQLSYTFRPRRRPKRLAAKREKYHHSLKALAIRENKIHVVGNPETKFEGTPVFLDVEGLPDRDFYYLIGVRFKATDGVVQHSLWADSLADEERLWTDFLCLLSEIENPVLLHYGSYEKAFLKRMCDRYGNPVQGSTQDKVIKSSVNLLSLVFAQIYFPTYSNGLKDVARFLGFRWSEPDASGVQSISWRHEWDKTRAPSLRQKLITYNREDCEGLELTASAIARFSPTRGDCSDGEDANVVAVESLKSLQTMWPKFTSQFSEFEQINKAARWDYQRDRVYVRSSKRIRQITVRKHKVQGLSRLDTKICVYPEQIFCPACNQKGHGHFRITKRFLHDLHIGRFNLRRRLVEYHYRVFWCSNCKKRFGIPTEFWPGSKYGRNLVAYMVYHSVKLCIPRAVVGESLNRLLGLGITPDIIHNLKISAAKYYKETHQTILNSLIKGSLLHVDETRVSIKGKTAYVWVFTNLHEVCYLYSDTRGGELVQQLLNEFRGVLISDFYAAYDSLNCPQQKCLIHLMRDLNAEVLNQPYDEELKEIVRGFAELLRPMVETVDRFGLKKHFLRKHLVRVQQFYGWLKTRDFHSEVATKCRQRFEKNRDKLFTFLRFDNVPWNNNNAEHAIKAFARLRDVIRGSCTSNAVKEYLVLLSVCQTCEYQGIDFLNFLCSGEKDIYAFAESKQRRRGGNARLPIRSK